MGEINVVPYIDVMLVLLIIFMITAPLLKEGIKVDLPTAGAKPIDAAFLQKHEPLIVTVDARGRLYVNFGPNSDKPADEATVSARTAALLRRDPQTPVLVKADAAVPLWHRGARDGAPAASGRGQVGLLTDPERLPRAGAGGRGRCALMASFVRENSGPVFFSVLLHGGLAAALIYLALAPTHPSVSVQSAPVNARWSIRRSCAPPSVPRPRKPLAPPNRPRGRRRASRRQGCGGEPGR